MLQGVIMQGFIWGLWQIILCPPCFSSKGIYHMVGEERSGEDLNHLTKWYERSRCRNFMTSNMLGEKMLSWSEVSPSSCPLLGTWDFPTWWSSISGPLSLLCSCLCNCLWQYPSPGFTERKLWHKETERAVQGHTTRGQKVITNALDSWQKLKCPLIFLMFDKNL